MRIDSLAELALMTIRAVIPPSLGFADAAGLLAALETATRALDQLGVAVGSTLFINGASGGIGSTTLSNGTLDLEYRRRR